MRKYKTAVRQRNIQAGDRWTNAAIGDQTRLHTDEKSLLLRKFVGLGRRDAPADSDIKEAARCHLAGASNRGRQNGTCCGYCDDDRQTHSFQPLEAREETSRIRAKSPLMSLSLVVTMDESRLRAIVGAKYYRDLAFQTRPVAPVAPATHA